MKKLSAIRNRLQRLVADGHGKVDPAKLDPILAELEALPDQHGRVGGVDIGVLRRNLTRALEMQRIALKVQRLAKNPDQSDTKELNTAIARLQKLQGEMEAVTVTPPVSTTTAPIQPGAKR